MKVLCLDLGTNTFRYLIADLSGKEVRYVGRGREVVGLGRALSRTGKVEEEDLLRALGVLKRWITGVGELKKVDKVIAIGTEVFRSSKNGREIIERIREETHFSIRIITPEEEARYAFLGGKLFSTTQYEWFLDIGGGSTEWVFGGKEPERWISTPIGVVTFAQRKDETVKEAVERAKRAIVLAVKNFYHETILKFEEGRRSPLVVSCGTSTALAMFFKGMEEYDLSLHGTFIPLKWLESWVLEFGSYYPEHLASTFLKRERSDLMGPGVGILLGILETLRAEGFYNSEYGVLEGVCIDFFRRGKGEKEREDEKSVPQ
jgi:exopolyphosphatase / guanosine-5'-triphosphate,3'-diphosphate pyrophosphatase